MNYNILPFYKSLDEQDRYKPHSDGQSYPLRCGKSLLPFQLKLYRQVYTAAAVYDDGRRIVINLPMGINYDSSRGEYSYIAWYKAQTVLDLPLGPCHIEITDVAKNSIWYSENITIVDDLYDFLKLTWWDKDTFKDGDSEIMFADNYRNFFYIPGPLGKPAYSFEDTTTTRDGFSYPDKRILKKTFRCEFCASEAVIDALCMARLADYCVLYDRDKRYSIADITITPQWTSQPNIARVTVEFVCGDSVTKKIAKSLTAADIADFNEDFNADYLIP